LNPYIENVYFKLPVGLQNIAVSLMGLKLYRERYNSSSGRYLKNLSKSETMTGTELALIQNDQFVVLAKHAIEQVPFYKDWSIKQGFTSNDIESLKDLNRFPIVEKSMVRDAPGRFLADNFKHKADLIKLHTSGTTGSPLTLYCDKNSRTHHYAFFSRLRSWYGLDSKSKRATLFGRIIMLPEQDSPPFWRYDVAQKNLLMSSYHLSERNIADYYYKLSSYQPDEIFSYPSSILPIARYITEHRLPKLEFKLLMTTAEPLFEYQRDVLKRAFNTPIVNQYGCTEMAFFADEPDTGTMRFHPEHGIAEVMQENGELSYEGRGELVASGLVNMAMPLIRYRIGDSVCISPIDKTQIGIKAFPVLDEIIGRTDDLIYRKNGTPVGRLDPVFKGMFSVRNAQICQKENYDIQVKVEPMKGFDGAERLKLQKAIQNRVGRNLTVNIETTEIIRKDSNGKFKAVVSYVKR